MLQDNMESVITISSMEDKENLKLKDNNIIIENSSLKQSKSKKKRKSIRTPKALINVQHTIDPSPMTRVFQRKQIIKNDNGKVCFIGDFTNPRSQLENILRGLNYVIVDEITKDLECVICNKDDNSELCKKAKEYNIPFKSEFDLFTKPSNESDTESENEDEIDSEDEELVIISEDEGGNEELENTSSIKNGERLKGKRIAFMGKFETSFFELRQSVLSQGGEVIPIQALVTPATHVVLSDEYGSPKEFRKEYSAYWWLRPAVFLSENDILDILDGVKVCPPTRQANLSVNESMKRLSLDTSIIFGESLGKKRKERPPRTPTKEVKPLFSFGSPERKKGRIETDEFSSFQFTSTNTLNSAEPTKLPKFKSAPQSIAAPIPMPQIEDSIPTTTIVSKDKTFTVQKFSVKPPKSKESNSSIPKSKSESIVVQTSVLSNDVPTIKSTVLAGKVFVLLGKFKNKRRYLEELIVSHSGSIPKSSHLSRKVTYLVYGEGAQSTRKFLRAVERGIDIITEDTLLSFIPS